MDKLKNLLEEILNDKLENITISNKVKKSSNIAKIKLRPIILKGEVVFQVTQYVGVKVIHENYSKEETIRYITSLLECEYKQAQIETSDKNITVLANKGHCSILAKQKLKGVNINQKSLEHNRKKQYILNEGTKIPFLIEQKVMTTDGRIINAKYDKFKQINRFLEFIEDIVPKLKREDDKEITIIDFGCGKSYLTFAIYYYLKVINNMNVRIIGLDLKEEVIDNCNSLKEKLGYTSLEFLKGDIADYDGATDVDMVVTLHACDTATDYALAKAIKWNAKVILSVPCCQHELNKQIENELFECVFKYGILKERMSALITDGLRANMLEGKGYEVDLLEFIDIEHTPKNILIRAVKKDKNATNKEGQALSATVRKAKKLSEELNVDPTILRLL